PIYAVAGLCDGRESGPGPPHDPILAGRSDQRGHDHCKGGKAMRLKGKKVALLAENSYQEMELWAPYYRLKEEGADVKVVGAGGAKSYASKAGYPVNVDVQADQVSAVEFDAVIIPGGYAPDMIRRHESMV